jgi:23S rRNA pseudouridine2605 synthase
MAQPVRLQKLLANAGVASRRKAEDLIRHGHVRVNGNTVTELGTRVDPDTDRVEVGGREIRLKAPVWIALHKPPGYLTSRGDPHGRPTIYELLPLEYRGLFYVGRLDVETEGLVLLTNDGDRAHRLQHPRYQVARVYDAAIEGEISERTISQLRHGVELEDGPAHFTSARILNRTTDVSQVRVTLAEGRKREVRRLFDAVGHPVLQLQRIRYGPIALGDLRAGQWRKLGTAETAAFDSESSGAWT